MPLRTITRKSLCLNVRNLFCAQRYKWHEFTSYEIGHFYGSIFVTVHAKVFLQGKYIDITRITRQNNSAFLLDFLKESDFLDDLDHIVKCFDETTKTRFRNSEEPQYIKFGSLRDNDPHVNIRIGQLKLSGYAVYFVLLNIKTDIL